MAFTVIGVFDHATPAQQAVAQLVDRGFSPASVDLFTPTGTHDNGAHPAVRGFFDALFGSDQVDTGLYAQVVSRSSLVTVHARTADEAERAARLLDDSGAVDVNERVTRDGGTYRPVPAETGSSPLRSRVVGRAIDAQHRLRDERVEPTGFVASIATSAGLTAFERASIDLIEYTEVPVVAKEARVVEEVALNTVVTERQETIHDTVRQTEVTIEPFDRTTPPNPTDRNDSDDGTVTYATT